MGSIAARAHASLGSVAPKAVTRPLIAIRLKSPPANAPTPTGATGYLSTPELAPEKWQHKEKIGTMGAFSSVRPHDPNSASRASSDMSAVWLAESRAREAGPHE